MDTMELSLEAENQARHVEQLANQVQARWKSILAATDSELKTKLRADSYSFGPAIAGNDGLKLKITLRFPSPIGEQATWVHLQITSLWPDAPDFECSFADEQGYQFGPSYPLSYSPLDEYVRDSVKKQVLKVLQGKQKLISPRTTTGYSSDKIKWVIERALLLLNTPT